MAIIPRADESQVLSAGSPVPVSSTGDARMMANVTSEFSSAMMKLGSQLAAVDKESVRQRQTLEADNASSDFETDIAVIEQELKKSADYGMLSNSEMLKKFQNEAQKVIDRRMRSIPDEGNTRAIFENKAKDATKTRALKFYADSINEYNKVTVGKLNEYVSKKASTVSNTISRSELDAALAATTSHVMSNNILTGTEKQEYLVKSRKELFEAYVNGHIQKMMASDNPDEREVLEKNALRIFEEDWTVENGLAKPKVGIPGIFNEDEKNALRNRIVEGRWKADNRQMQQINALEAMDMRSTRNKSERTFRNLGVEIFTKVTDAATLSTAKARILNAVERGDLSADKAESAIQMAHSAALRKRFENKESVDSMYRVSFTEKLLDSKEPEALVSDAYDATTKFGVSGSEAIALMESAEKAVVAMHEDPNIRSTMQESARAFDQVRQMPGFDRLSREAQLEVEASARVAKEDLYNLFLINPRFDIKKTTENILNQKINPVLEKYKLKTQPKSINIDQELKKIGDEYNLKLKSSSLTRDDELAYKKRINDLVNMKKNQGGR